MTFLKENEAVIDCVNKSFTIHCLIAINILKDCVLLPRAELMSTCQLRADLCNDVQGIAFGHKDDVAVIDGLVVVRDNKVHVAKCIKCLCNVMQW